MKIHDLVYLPDEVLRQPAALVTTFDDALRQLVEEMFATMYEVKGVGLAAPQIGISMQLAVIDTTPDKSERYVLINPTITHREGEERFQEGCLSIPGVYDTVTRSAKVTMQAVDEYNKPYELTASGLLGEAVQHEIEHLQGILFVDLLSPLKRKRARQKLEKFKRSQKK